MLTVAAAALAYRFLVALAGPLWIVRSASGKMQKRASATSLMVLVGIQAAFNLVMLFTSEFGSKLLVNAYFAISGQLIVGAGLALALALYRNVPQGQVAEEPEELSPESLAS
jgi:protein-S-isoprenylcysteine O-methyltransferase Ste14